MRSIIALGLLFIFNNCFSQTIENKTFETTEETQNLLNYLHSLSESNKILFGHHLSNVERQSGTDWNKANDKTYSDVYAATGSMPAVFSFDFGRGISKATSHCKSIFSWGGIITFSWHAKNPISGGKYNDLTGNPMREICTEGTTAYDYWKDQLDQIADELNSLQHNGIKIPIIFRPFHEHTGAWFWWGKDNCSDEEYILAWRYTTDYLRNKGVDNMLIAYSPSKPAQNSENKRLTQDRYPGDDYVDILGFDQYDKNQLNLIRDAVYMVEMAEKKGKVAAITEFGNRNGLNNKSETIENWFTLNMDPLHAHPVASKVAYALTWMNTEQDSYWVPISGDKQYNDFMEYINSDYSLLLDDLPDVYSFAVADTIPDNNPDSVTVGVNLKTELFRDGDENEVGFNIFPNPNSTGILHFNKLYSNGEISLIDVLGKEILSVSINKAANSLNIGKLPRGLYFVRIEDGEKINSVKLVVE